MTDEIVESHPPIHYIRLYFPDILARPHDEPMIMSWFKEGTGTSFAVGVRSPSARRDVVKVTITEVFGLVREVRLTQDSERELVDEKGIRYTVREPCCSAEIASCRRILAQFGEE